MTEKLTPLVAFLVTVERTELLQIREAARQLQRQLAAEEDLLTRALEAQRVLQRRDGYILRTYLSREARS